MTTQTGFLLSYIKYGDYDAVLQCFTIEKGFQSFFIKGIFSTKNKNRALLRPLNEICFSFSKTPQQGKMPLITKMELVENPNFYNDVKSNTIVFFVAEFLKSILKNESETQIFYQEILYFLNELEAGNFSAHYIFLIECLVILGFAPLQSDGNYLDPEKGQFINHSSQHFFDKEITELWKTILAKDQPYSTKIPSINKKNMLQSILQYYQIHISEFRTPKSLDIIMQIVEVRG
jgi:DNA repair protein RecO (recombination protein O)